MRLVLECVEQSFKAHAEGKTVLPPKIVLDLDERRVGRINAMPAYVGGTFDICGIKWIAGFPRNPIEHGIPRATGLIIINDSKKGVPLAVMDATLISAMRTGAVTGIGAEYLARKSSETVGIIGCGVQARTQLMALKIVLRDLRKVRAFDVRKDRAEQYAKDTSERLGLNVEAVGTPREAVEKADLIVTVTVADEPIVKNSWLQPGTLFSHIGSYQEEEYDVVLDSDKIVVDDWEQVKHRGTPVLAKMYKEGLIREDDIYGNLGDIVVGRKLGRENESERIFLLPIGMGSEDIAVASRVYDMALRHGIGTKLRLWSNPEFP